MQQPPKPQAGLFNRLEVQSPDALDYQLDIAGLGARSHAFIIDLHIRFLLALTWVLVVGGGVFSLDTLRGALKHNETTGELLMVIIPAFCLYFFYHPVLEVLMAGRTPGKRMAGVRLVNRLGHTPSIGAILLRNVLRMVDSLPGIYLVGLLAVAFTRDKVRIGDLAADLVLVYDNRLPAKTLEQMTRLALSSDLSGDDQALLLDLLKRWDGLSVEVRIRFAGQFLARIGQPMPPPDAKPDLAFKKALEKLLPPS
ncbi:RDD family protein [Methylovulum psychrotolerans]|uniref:RDD domain-containing protein n=1 Tax=Methylovulum psychrotolerans TaxID=1704499 RepID=A0A1Z4BVR5_9GAMM|nr:RDD family protein [Methylovulum psychrotolerans]ASF45299.1 hypothetical protein CEK71_04030 [Methylovulum psychrotolerans]